MTGAESTVAALETALGSLPVPIVTPMTCTDAVAVTVTRHGRRGRLVTHATARMASGHTDRDHVTLLCRAPAGRSVTFARLQAKIFTPSCAITSCHGAAASGGLTLSAGAAYASLVGVAPTNTSAQSAGLLRVAPGDPDRSFLLRKLEGTLAAGEGEPMPRVGATLDPPLIDLVRRWIAAGAPAEAPF